VPNGLLEPAHGRPSSAHSKQRKTAREQAESGGAGNSERADATCSSRDRPAERTTAF
jgi:hypothetical protein